MKTPETPVNLPECGEEQHGEPCLNGCTGRQHWTATMLVFGELTKSGDSGCGRSYILIDSEGVRRPKQI